MSGYRLIDEIVKRLVQGKVPPTDANILSCLRGIADIQEWIKGGERERTTNNQADSAHSSGNQG